MSRHECLQKTLVKAEILSLGIAVDDLQAAYDKATRLSRNKKASGILPRLRAAVHALLQAELKVGDNG